MTQEYEFFKDFAGVTKADLEMFKCGGKSKVKKGQGGVKTEAKRSKPQTTILNDDKDNRTIARKYNYSDGTSTTIVEEQANEWPNYKNGPRTVTTRTGAKYTDNPNGNSTGAVYNKAKTDSAFAASTKAYVPHISRAQKNDAAWHKNRAKQVQAAKTRKK